MNYKSVLYKYVKINRHLILLYTMEGIAKNELFQYNDYYCVIALLWTIQVTGLLG